MDFDMPFTTDPASYCNRLQEWEPKSNVTPFPWFLDVVTILLEWVLVKENCNSSAQLVPT